MNAMKPEAQKILTMIEAVTAETAVEVLDEIDARVWCFGNEIKFEKPLYFEHPKKGNTHRGYRTGIGDISTWLTPSKKDGTSWKLPRRKFTRSIDAQEALRREGWMIDVFGSLQQGYGCRLAHHELEAVYIYVQPTEPLARLHAWVQVWGMEE